MSRTQCEEDRRMEKFEGVFDRWERRELTQAEAAEILGRSEWQFRRYIDIHEAEGLEGLRDGRLAGCRASRLKPRHRADIGLVPDDAPGLETIG
jgi:hypothetical protein